MSTVFHNHADSDSMHSKRNHSELVTRLLSLDWVRFQVKYFRLIT